MFYCIKNQQKLHDMELQLQEAFKRIKWLEENHWTNLPSSDISPFIPPTPNHNESSTNNAQSLLATNITEFETINSAECKDILSFCSSVLPRPADAIGEDNTRPEEIPKKSPMPQRKRVNQNPGGITDGKTRHDFSNPS